MPPDAAEALNLFYPAANAAYGCQDPIHMLIGNSFSFTNQIKVDPVKAAKVPPQHLPMLSSMLKVGPIFGYVARRDGAVFVSFRGTETPEEWLCDFEAVPAHCDIGSGTVHEGFQKVYEVVRDSAIGASKAALKDGDQLLVTGHSLGAALALLFADDAFSNVTPNVRVCTFAGPRVGLPDWVGTFNHNLPNTARVVNRWDIVPNVPVPAPPACLYEHVQSVIAIDGGFTTDLAQAHSLPLSYMPGLKKHVPQPQVAGAAAAADHGQ